MRLVLKRDSSTYDLAGPINSPNHQRSMEHIKRTFNPAVTAALRQESGRRGSTPRFSYAGLFWEISAEDGENVAVCLIHEDTDEAVTKDTPL